MNDKFDDDIFEEETDQDDDEEQEVADLQTFKDVSQYELAQAYPMLKKDHAKFLQDLKNKKQLETKQRYIGEIEYAKALKLSAQACDMIEEAVSWENKEIELKEKLLSDFGIAFDDDEE